MSWPGIADIPDLSANRQAPALRNCASFSFAVVMHVHHTRECRRGRWLTDSVIDHFPVTLALIMGSAEGLQILQYG